MVGEYYNNVNGHKDELERSIEIFDKAIETPYGDILWFWLQGRIASF